MQTNVRLGWEGGRKPTYLTSTTSVLTSVLTSVKAISVVPSGGNKTDVCRENMDVRWVGFHPLLERFARDKHSSLLRKLVNYGRKKFYRIGPRSGCRVFRISTHDPKFKGLNPGPVS